MARFWLRWQLLSLFVLLTACADLRRLLPPGQDTQQSRGAAVGKDDRSRPDLEKIKERRIALERCLRERPGLEAQMADLRATEAHLAHVKGESYGGLPGPEPWDEAKESRFRVEDREADWQKHLQAREDWKQRNQSRQRAWETLHRERLRAAQSRVDEQALSLRAQEPDLFTGPGSIEFNPLAVHRIRHCDTPGGPQQGNPG
ncbi:MAG: hypothetical protein ACKOOH_05280 [Cyanobium sp.]